MSTQFNLDPNQADYNNVQGKVKVTDLLNRLNEEKKIEKKRNLAKIKTKQKKLITSP